MSLRDEFEKWWDEPKDSVVDMKARYLQCWQEATERERERALRIVREEIEGKTHHMSAFSVFENIERRLKGDDNG